MGSRRAISEARDVNISFTGAPMPIDAYKAAVETVVVMEGKWEKNPNPAVNPDLASTAALITGALPFQLYAFNVTTTNSSGVYAFEFVETRPNAVN